jgi:hypothetical protein
MHVRALFFLAAFAGLASAQSPPAAPVVTVGAENRQLIFDWDPVPGATSYFLVFKMDRNSSYVPVSNGPPIAAPTHRARVNISVHKLNWRQARFKVAACNGPCTYSDEVSVQDLMLDAIGYFKASNTGMDDQFGRGVALSGDGKTLVVTAANEDSAATGVNGNQADNTSMNSGAVYVYRRATSGAWRQEAYLKADTVNTEQFFGYGYPIDYQAIAVNNDGTLIAVGAPGERPGSFYGTGAAYIFSRATNGTWSQAQKLTSPAPIARDFLYYGAAIDLSGDGNTLRVLELKERDGEGNRQGEHHIYVRSGGAFVYQTTLTIPHNEVDFCNSGRLSGDGNTFVQYCISYGPEHSRVVTWKRAAAGWVKLPAVVLIQNAITVEVALSYGGERLAFRDASHPFSSNVRVFSWGDAAWVEDATIETPPGTDSGSSWGHILAFANNGNTLAIGDFLSYGGGLGVSDTIQTTPPYGGAVFLYARTSSTTNRWQFRKLVKAPNAEDGDGFGLRIAMCSNGNALAISAIWESSGATGVDGNQLDNSVATSGAVYLY